MPTKKRSAIRAATFATMFAMALAMTFAASLAGARPVAAHPHVWVTAQTDVVFDDSRRVIALRHVWTFDEMYSSWALQDLGGSPDGSVDPARLDMLAEENAVHLHEFEYFTHMRANGSDQRFLDPTDYAMSYENGRLVFRFTLPLARPAEADRALLLDVSDPEFFVSFRMAEGNDAVRLLGGPQGCSMTITRPADIWLETTGDLSEDLFLALTATANFDELIANRTQISCP